LSDSADLVDLINSPEVITVSALDGFAGVLIYTEGSIEQGFFDIMDGKRITR
jgi:hypothetical protein